MSRPSITYSTRPPRWTCRRTAPRCAWARGRCNEAVVRKRCGGRDAHGVACACGHGLGGPCQRGVSVARARA
eukprot:15173770-Alexandrium_andersonii.AAC.1